MKKMILMLAMMMAIGTMANVAGATVTKQELQAQADAGDVKAQLAMGAFSEDTDPVKARHYYELAVAQGDRHAARNLNAFNAVQDTIDRVKERAAIGYPDQCSLRIAKESAEQDSHNAAWRAKIKDWAEKAAKGDPKAQLNMGYHNMNTDVFVARMYFKMAADQGYKDAINDLKRLDEQQTQAKK